MSRWEHSPAASRPSLAPAIVSGGFAVFVALITGAFNWLSRPGHDPAPPAPTLAMEPPHGTEPLRTAAATHEDPDHSTVRHEPRTSFSLNFAAFQSTVKDPHAAAEVRRQALGECLGRLVLWRGLVDEVVAMPPESGFAWTVVLCEDEQTLEQTAFKAPALCRFRQGDDRIARLRHGERISISGTCAEHSALGTILIDCDLTGRSGR